LTGKKVQIGPRQLFFLIITMVISTVDIFVPAFIAQEAGNDSWISAILAGVAIFPITFILLKLYHRYEGYTLIEICKKAAGKFFGTIIGLLYILYFMVIAFSVSSEMGQVIKTAFMPLTPNWVFVIISILVSAYAVGRDIEVIARINEILLPLGLAVLEFLLLVNINDFNFGYFLPVLKEGFIPPIRGSLIILGWMSEPVAILQVLPFVNKPENMNKAVYFGMLMVCIGIMSGTLIYALFGPLTELLLIPSLEFARFASLGKYLYNFDLLIMAIWVTGIFVKIMVFYHVSAFSLAQLWKADNYKNLILPVGLLIVSIAVSTQGEIVKVLHFLHYIFPLFSITMAFVLPAILLVLSFFRKEKR